MRKYLLIFILNLLFNFSSQADHQIISYDFNKWYRDEVKGSESYLKFKFNLRDDKDVKKEIKNNSKTGIISYLLYENNEITIDESDLPGFIKSNKSYLASYSVGKSMVSYVTGHAICEGYIDSVDVVLDDWSILENTLYHGQKLIDLLNMNAGDQRYIGERPNVNQINEHDNRDSYFKGTAVYVNEVPLKYNMEYLENKKKSRPVYNYSALTTNVVMNYVVYKSGENWQNLLNKVFNDHVKVENSVYFQKNNNDRSLGSLNYHFYATRYDYLRIAKAMLDDWNNDTCVGKYLKTVYERKINKGSKDFKPKYVAKYSKKYGGQFHFNIVGLEKRAILGMDGYGGQQILIDFDKQRIIVLHSVDRHYNWSKIVYKKLKQK